VSAKADHPFITFAGSWAQATWTLEHDAVADTDNFDDALAEALEDSNGKYQMYVEGLEAVAATLGFGPIGRGWELFWIDELEPLRSAVCQVAAMLVGGQMVTHDIVRALLPPDEGTGATDE
jgi:hypothetical protein